MFNLIKYEFKYQNIGILYTLLATAAIFIYASFSFHRLIINYLLLFLLLYYAAQSFSIQVSENRNNFLRILPISDIQKAISRILYHVIMFALILLVGFIFYLIIGSNPHSWSNSLGELIMFGELSLALVLYMFILVDIFTIFRKRIGQIFFIVLASGISIFILLLTLTIISKTYSINNFGSYFNKLLLMIIVCEIVMSIFTFNKKRSFTKF